MGTDRILELVGIWFTGVATLSATVVALFLPKLYRPRFSVSCNKDGLGSSSYIVNEADSSNEELWIKVGVKNRSDTNAEDVELRLILIRNRSVHGRKGYMMFSSWWLKVSALNTNFISIPPRYTQYYDLCYLIAQSERRSMSVHVPAVRPPMKDWPHERQSMESDPMRILSPRCQYDVVFAVSGKNTHASYFSLPIQYDDLSNSLRPRVENEDVLRRALRVGTPNRVSSQIELDDLGEDE